MTALLNGGNAGLNRITAVKKQPSLRMASLQGGFRNTYSRKTGSSQAIYQLPATLKIKEYTIYLAGAFGQQGFSVEPQDELVAPGHNTT